MSGTLAHITLVGRLARDAELKHAASGLAIASFTVVTDARVRTGDAWADEPSYWDVALFGKQAEAVAQYLTKGKHVSVAGETRIDTWEKDGLRHSKTKINADRVVLLGSKPTEGQAPAEKPAAGDDFNDDIPF